MSLYTFLPLLNLWAQKDQFTLKIYLNVHFSSLSVTIILVIIQYVLNAHYVLEKKPLPLRLLKTGCRTR